MLWEGQQYPGIVTGIEEKGVNVDCMHVNPLEKYWIWPEQKDNLFYEWKLVIKKINPPKKSKERISSCH